MNLFGRAWRVQIGEFDTSELACKFKVTRSLFGPGTCELEIYNLSADHRRAIVAAPRRSTIVEIQAGYVGGRSLIFRGDKRKAIMRRDGTDYVLVVTAGDGEHARRTARVNRAFAGGASLPAVVQYIADAMGVGVGNAVDALRAATFDTGGADFGDGTVLSGFAAGELTRLCNSARLTWSVQDSALQLLPLGGALAREAILLSPDTGLVGAPEIVNRRTCTVKALIIPGLVPGQRVTIQSQIRSGVHRISACEFAGDTHGSDWYASMTCALPRPPLLTR